MPKIIFISGIHGTGKTTVGQNIAQKLGLEFASASQIIKNYAGQNWSKQKEVQDISINQDFLYKGIKKYYSNSNVIILDGHFTLLNNLSKISNIPEKTFSKLDIALTVTCTLDAQSIKNRLYERDKTSFELKLLEDFQNAEINQAHIISKKLGAPLLFYNSKNDSVDFIISKIKEERIL